MKTLYLVRHAKSSWKYPELDDFERPLNRRGRKSLMLMGAFLKKNMITPDLIISSPATRAAMTARIVSDAINYPLDKIIYNEAIYLFDMDVLLRVIQDMSDDVKEAMLIGHNPALTDLASYMVDSQVINIPTGGILCAELNISSWPESGERCGKMKFLESPGGLVS